MERPVLFDFCSGAGGAAMGYFRGGWAVVGIDIEPQPHFPFPFVQGDAVGLLRALLAGERVAGYALEDIDGFHVSPPCPRFSILSKSWNGNPDAHPDLIAPMRELLARTGRPYVIENVVGARRELRAPVMLCGSMFGLAVERHRLFESNARLIVPACDHTGQALTWPDGFPALRSGREGKRARVVGVFGTGGGRAKDFDTWKWAMGIGWMRTKAEVADSIPPAYTHHIGTQLRAALDAD